MPPTWRTKIWYFLVFSCFLQVSGVLTLGKTWGQPVGKICTNSHWISTSGRRVTAVLLFWRTFFLVFQVFVMLFAGFRGSNLSRNLRTTRRKNLDQFSLNFDFRASSYSSFTVLTYIFFSISRFYRHFAWNLIVSIDNSHSSWNSASDSILDIFFSLLGVELQQFSSIFVDFRRFL